MSIGVIEGFFGPQWPKLDRLSYAPFLQKYGGDFYIYAPKQDSFLRKAWRNPWTPEYLSELKELCEAFHRHGLKFGVGFSPFELGTDLKESDRELLREKLLLLQEVGIDILGLFFDDMPVSDQLAQTQIHTIEVVREVFKNKIIFCPSYYTPDPILDKVFGARPPHYLEEISNGLPLDIAMAWTGPKVISPEIPAEHLRETSLTLKRKPFVWENFFANDGPKNCKFLKMKPFAGRSAEALGEMDGIGLNLMNQPELSKILFLASVFAMKEEDAQLAYEKAVRELSSNEFAAFLLANGHAFLEKGLDQIPFDEKDVLIKKAEEMPDKAAQEVCDWLRGKYLVGSECLTD
jgi:hyaluronoglucosaminidase